jgi:hypothetical protein
MSKSLNYKSNPYDETNKFKVVFNKPSNTEVIAYLAEIKTLSCTKTTDSIILKLIQEFKQELIDKIEVLEVKLDALTDKLNMFEIEQEETNSDSELVQAEEEELVQAEEEELVQAEEEELVQAEEEELVQAEEEELVQAEEEEEELIIDLGYMSDDTYYDL